MVQAVRLVPHLIVVRPDFKAYTAASKQVMALLGNTTPFIEQISIDEAFLDVTGLAGAGEPLAGQLQTTIRETFALPCSFGVASNKLVAKIANNIGKASKGKDAPPNAIQVVPPGGEAAFLAPLPIDDLWGVGPKTAAHLRDLGIQTIGDVARFSQSDLDQRFGKHGSDLWQRANGIDDRPIETEHESKSISRETTFNRDEAEEARLRQMLHTLAEGVGWRLRQAGLQGNTVRLKLRWSDFTTFTRQTSFTHGIDSDDEIYAAALQLFNDHWTTGRAVRLMGVGIAGLSETHKQLELFQDAPTEKQRQLQTTLDKLKARFGEGVIQRGGDNDL